MSFWHVLPYMTKMNIKLFLSSFILTVLLWDTYMGYFFLGAAATAVLWAAWYLFFDDTLNRVQYLPIGGGQYLYYLTRDNGGKGTPWFFKSFMVMTSFPWLKGNGHTFRLSRGLTFQVGTARKTQVTVGEDGLSKALGAHPLDMPVEDIRDLEPSRLVKKVD